MLVGDGGFASDEDSDPAVTAERALRLSAVWSCMHLRAETIGSLPLHLRDAKKNIIRDHDLYGVLHHSPNAMMTAAEYWSLMTAHVDMHGNALSVIQRRANKSVISLEPMDPTTATMEQRRGGSWFYKWPGGEEHPAENILHLRGFSMVGNWGMPRIEVGRHILGAQLQANEAALRAFRSGLKVGGFFEVQRNLDREQLKEFKTRLDTYGESKNAGKWMTLLAGMKPIGGAEFRVKPVDAELLLSRHFGIEEICRLFNTPPQLIGHTDKASSWASSQEQINLFYLMYSLMPTLVRSEQRIIKSLVSPTDAAAGIQGKFGIQGLLRADMKTQQEFFASGLQNGYLCRDEVRDLLERGTIEGGDKFTIQMNMTGINKTPKEAQP